MKDTDSEIALNTILSTCFKQIPTARGDKVGVLEAKIAYLEYRLDEIRLIAEKQVIANARANVKFDDQFPGVVRGSL